MRSGLKDSLSHEENSMAQGHQKVTGAKARAKFTHSAKNGNTKKKARRKAEAKKKGGK